MAEGLKNFAETTLNGAINDSTVTVTVTDGSLLPAVPFYLVVETEIMRVTAKSTNTLTVVRGQESTSAASHADLSPANAPLTVQALLNAISDYGSLTWLSTTQGAIPYCGASGVWTTLAATTNYSVLSTNGTTTNPSYRSLPTLFEGPFGTTQGSILYCGSAGTWQAKTAGTAGYILRTQGTSSDPTWESISQCIDSIGSTRGSLLYRGSGGWAILTPGTSGYLLKSNGTGADPSWDTVSAAIDSAIGSTRGSILIRGASGWAQLTPGTSGNLLQTAGAGADPAFTSFSSILNNFFGNFSSNYGGIVRCNSSGTGYTTLVPSSTSGYILRSNGSNTDISYDSISNIIDTIGSSTGAVLYRGSGTGWQALAAPGVAGSVFTSGSSIPSWQTKSDLLDGITNTQGSILARTGSAWAGMSPGLSGDVLTAAGSGQNIAWASPGLPGTFGGRLSLESGVPVSTTNQTAKTTLYAVPHPGSSFGCGVITTYESSRWIKRTFTNTSVSLSGFTASLPYDVFGYFSSGVFTLDCVAWTNATTRATALATQDGVYVKTSATDRLYLGTILTTSTTGQCEFSYGSSASGGGAAYVGIWNRYNQIPIECVVLDSTTSWTYNSATWRSANNSTTNRITFVTGIQERPVAARLTFAATGGVTSDASGVIGYDSTTTPATGADIGYVGASTNAVSSAGFSPIPTVGTHYFQRLETRLNGANAGTFYGVSTNISSALRATIWC